MFIMNVETVGDSSVGMEEVFAWESVRSESRKIWMEHSSRELPRHSLGCYRPFVVLL